MAEERGPAIIPVKFWTEYVPDLEHPGEKKPEDWVRWERIGTTNGAATSEKIARLAPRDNRAAAVEWAAIKGGYEMWKEGEAPIHDGTPIGEWPGGTQDLTDVLKKFRVYTCEAFTGMPDGEVGKIPYPNARALRDNCRKFMQAKSDHAGVAAENAALQRQVEAMRLEMDELKALLRVNPPAETARRGRPRKAA